MGEAGRPREQHFSGLHRHGNDEDWDEQPGMVRGLVEVYTYGSRWRATGGGECGGFSRIRGEQLFYGKQSGRRRRLYVLVKKVAGGVLARVAAVGLRSRATGVARLENSFC